MDTPTKVSYLPIDAKLTRGEGQPTIECKIARLEEIGLIFKSTQHFFRPGEEYICNFDLPLSDLHIQVNIKIIKTYEKVEEFLVAGEKERVMTVEVHYKQISSENRTAIRNFNMKIGQKKI